MEKELEKFRGIVMECANYVHMCHETCWRAEEKGE